ncbi:MAG: IS1380 family transposase, partial [Prevotellaceae bacterium]|nr:IS1380 family transposase [Prevotellaceae bacterium]
MTKVQKSSQKISPLAGIYFVNDEFNSSHVQQLIDNELGIRVSTCGYSYGKIFKNWFNLFFCGGECAEDIQQHLRPTLSQIPNN